jgi:valyl-tRNA synthetase
VFDGILKLVHPFMPHITEEIWHTLTQKSDEVLALQPYPDLATSETGEGGQANKRTSGQGDSSTNLSASSSQTPIPNGDSSGLDNSLAQVQQIWNQGVRIVSELPDLVGNFFTSYQRQINLVGLILLALIALRVVGAVLGAINTIPLVQPSFESVGLGYSIWFVYRYLLTVTKRQELAAATQSIREQIVGQIEAQKAQEIETGEETSSRENHLPTTSSDSPLPNHQSPATNPQVDKTSLIDPELEQQFELLIGTIRTIRNLRAEADIKPGVKVPVILQSDSADERQILEAGQSYIQELGKVETLTITPTLDKELKTTMAGVVGTVQALIPLAGVVDVDALRAKLEKDLAKVEAEIKSLSGRLANEKFVSKAPDEVVQGVKDSLAEAQKQAEILRDRLNRLATES